MVENICAEVLLTGLLWVNNKTMDFDKRNKIYINYENNQAYVIPDDYSLITNKCEKEMLVKSIDKTTMKSFITKIN